MKTLNTYQVTDSATSKGYEVKAVSKKEAIKSIVESNRFYKSESALKKYTYKVEK